MTSPIVTLRSARDDDAERILEWRNDADAIRFSVSGRRVTGEDHARWFATRRHDPRVHLWIAEVDGTAVAQVRVDEEADGVGVVSIAVAPAHRRRGIGSEMLRAIADTAAAETTVRVLRALVHPDNVQSVRAFEKAGFRMTAAQEGDFTVLERGLDREPT
jgi:UDP-2,4-diacetamido-2,4,6-trideoxy-beta-L-altropyranose hydrolase